MEANEQYKEIFENLNDGVYYVDRDRRITFWNKGAERISGFSSDEVINTHCYDNVLMHTNDAGSQLCVSGCPLLSSIQNNRINVASVYLLHKAGYRVPVSVRTVPIVENGEVFGAVEIFQVQHERMESLYNMQELKTLALTDQLTGLPNRRYTETFLASRISEYKALGINFGVLFMDIDHFKLFNDQYGHGVGDDVLRILAKTFTSNLRNSDFIGRWGGEIRGNALSVDLRLIYITIILSRSQREDHLRHLRIFNFYVHDVTCKNTIKLSDYKIALNNVNVIR